MPALVEIGDEADADGRGAGEQGMEAALVALQQLQRRAARPGVADHGAERVAGQGADGHEQYGPPRRRPVARRRGTQRAAQQVTHRVDRGPDGHTDGQAVDERDGEALQACRRPRREGELDARDRQRDGDDDAQPLQQAAAFARRDGSPRRVHGLPLGAVLADAAPGRPGRRLDCEFRASRPGLSRAGWCDVVMDLRAGNSGGSRCFVRPPQSASPCCRSPAPCDETPPDGVKRRPARPQRRQNDGVSSTSSDSISSRPSSMARVQTQVWRSLSPW